MPLSVVYFRDSHEGLASEIYDRNLKNGHAMRHPSIPPQSHLVGRNIPENVPLRKLVDHANRAFALVSFQPLYIRDRCKGVSPKGVLGTKCCKLVALIALSHFCLRFGFLSRNLLHTTGRKVSQSVAKLSQSHKVVAKCYKSCHKVVAKLSGTPLCARLVGALGPLT